VKTLLPEKDSTTGRKPLKNVENTRSLKLIEKHFSSFKHFNNLAFLHKLICNMLRNKLNEGRLY
jgi:hypothetical protein